MKAILFFLLLLISAPSFAQDPTGRPPIFVGKLHGDYDPEKDSITYRIVAGNYGNFFFLVDEFLFVKQEAYKKFTNYRSWRLIFEVCDRSGNCDIKLVTIKLRKVNGVIQKPREIIVT